MAQLRHRRHNHATSTPSFNDDARNYYQLDDAVLSPLISSQDFDRHQRHHRDAIATRQSTPWWWLPLLQAIGPVATALRLSTASAARLIQNATVSAQRCAVAAVASCRNDQLLSTGLPVQIALSMDQAQALRGIVANIRPYDSSCEEHEQMLLKLWNVVFPAEPLPSRKGKHWSRLGFQGKDPATDFRGMGVWALQLILHFATYHTSEFKAQLAAQAPYPFSCAGINIAHTLLKILGLHTAVATVAATSKAAGSDIPLATQATANVALMLTQSDRAECDHTFGELFVVCFRALHTDFISANAGYMDFPNVMKGIESKVSATLEQDGVATVTRFAERMGVEFTFVGRVALSPAYPLPTVGTVPLDWKAKDGAGATDGHSLRDHDCDAVEYLRHQSSYGNESNGRKRSRDSTQSPQRTHCPTGILIEF